MPINPLGNEGNLQSRDAYSNVGYPHDAEIWGRIISVVGFSLAWEECPFLAVTSYVSHGHVCIIAQTPLDRGLIIDLGSSSQRRAQRAKLKIADKEVSYCS